MGVIAALQSAASRNEVPVQRTPRWSRTQSLIRSLSFAGVEFEMQYVVVIPGGVLRNDVGRVRARLQKLECMIEAARKQPW